MDILDTIIIGGGPAGLSAGIYAMRSRLNAILLERYLPGGQVMVADFIENYPGFPSGIGGADLGMAMEQQARELGLQIKSTEVVSLDLNDREKIVHTTEGEMRAYTVIIATGSNSRRLGVPGEDQFIGRGVSYCATCDGAFFKDKDIAVVGGGDTAVQDAIFLTRFARSVKIIHRRDALRAAKLLQERAMKNPKIEIIWNTIVTGIHGKHVVDRVGLRNVVTEEESVLPIDGIFILIGADPNTQFLKGLLDLDKDGYVITNADMETSAPQVYAVGDCRKKTLRQIVTAAADGAIASVSAEKYIECLGDS